jgi:hypothetical protein
MSYSHLPSKNTKNSLDIQEKKYIIIINKPATPLAEAHQAGIFLGIINDQRNYLVSKISSLHFCANYAASKARPYHK